MLLKALNGFSQAVIIVLALVLVITITTKHTSTAAVDDLQRQINDRMDADKIYYNGRIKTVEDNLNTYQQTREQRAKLYSSRLDELYTLYQTDPAPIDDATPGKAVGIAVTPNAPTEQNQSYLENRINNLAEKVDTNNNKIQTRVEILEQRVSNAQGNKETSVKVINNNLNTLTSK